MNKEENKKIKVKFVLDKSSGLYNSVIIKLENKEESENGLWKEWLNFATENPNTQYFLEDIYDWWSEKLCIAQIKSHETSDKYCCACDYDVTVFENRIAETEARVRKEIIESKC